MLVSSIIAAIKIEAKQGSTELDDFILSLINEVLKDYTAKAFYNELFVKDLSIVLPTTGILPLPGDLQHFLRKSIRYNGENFLVPYNRYRNTSTGKPAQFIRQGTSLLITPIADIAVSGDTIVLDYYKYPTSLVTGSTFPIQSLESVVKKEVIARMMTFDDMKKYPAYKSEANQSYIAASAQRDG